jgi:hypothetical protein
MRMLLQLISATESHRKGREDRKGTLMVTRIGGQESAAVRKAHEEFGVS